MKNVRLVVGEGDNKVEVGTAEIQPIPNGDATILLTVTNPQIVSILGGNQLKGIIPQYVEEEESGE